MVCFSNPPINSHFTYLNNSLSLRYSYDSIAPNSYLFVLKTLLPSKQTIAVFNITLFTYDLNIIFICPPACMSSIDTV